MVSILPEGRRACFDLTLRLTQCPECTGSPGSGCLDVGGKQGGTVCRLHWLTMAEAYKVCQLSGQSLNR